MRSGRTSRKVVVVVRSFIFGCFSFPFRKENFCFFWLGDSKGRSRRSIFYVVVVSGFVCEKCSGFVSIGFRRGNPGEGDRKEGGGGSIECVYPFGIPG